MNKEVHMYLGIAATQEGNIQNYPQGEKHAISLLLLQLQGSQANWEKAEETISLARWCNIELTKHGIMSEEKAMKSKQPFPDMFQGALSNGSAMLVYNVVEQ